MNVDGLRGLSRDSPEYFDRGILGAQSSVCLPFPSFGRFMDTMIPFMIFTLADSERVIGVGVVTGVSPLKVVVGAL